MPSATGSRIAVPALRRPAATLCLARALAIEPQVLLLDEPTSILDPVATESIEALIRTLVPRLTVVIVTHNLAQARRVSDRTVFLNQGRLVRARRDPAGFENPPRRKPLATSAAVRLAQETTLAGGPALLRTGGKNRAKPRDLIARIPRASPAAHV